MLPSVVSRQIAASISAFLRAAFPLNSPLFNGEAIPREAVSSEAIQGDAVTREAVASEAIQGDAPEAVAVSGDQLQRDQLHDEQLHDDKWHDDQLHDDQFYRDPADSDPLPDGKWHNALHGGSAGGGSAPGAVSMLERFLAQPSRFLKGSYLSAQLPFRKQTGAADFFPHLTLPFPPHAHQMRAFQRLSGDAPQSTLVATGTGSGKTECFMYPLLNYCAGTPGRGIKAIIIYPMNALATDQAGRFAGVIARDAKLRGRVTVGLFIGDSSDREQQTMSDDQVITCKHTLRESPPDILLTNYKMLDYLLMRPVDQPLWRYNSRGLLRYLVVDELHTFDGAQGSDLACLLRRLKYHTNVDSEHFACIGTSATAGDDAENNTVNNAADNTANNAADNAADNTVNNTADHAVNQHGQKDGAGSKAENKTDTRAENKAANKAEHATDSPVNSSVNSPVNSRISETARLLEYAQTIFDQPFTADAVIREDRYSADEYLQGCPIIYSHYPPAEATNQLKPHYYPTATAYLNGQIPLWFRGCTLQLPREMDSDAGRAARVALAALLRQHSVLHVLLKEFQRGIVSERQCSEKLRVMLAESADHAALVLQSILALISCARIAVDEEEPVQQSRQQAGKPRPVLPFVQLRSQLWLREMRRLVVSVSVTPLLAFADDLAAENRVHYLPVIHCRDCHAAGWLSVRSGNVPLETEPDAIYRQFFAKGKDTTLVFPDYSNKAVSGEHYHLCPHCLTLNKQTDTQCRQCGASSKRGLLRVLVPAMTKESEGKREFDNVCPYCQSRHGLVILGSRAASLSAVMIHQLYGSRFNEHKKLITFSDSVQDAAHRAGFFTARTWPLMIRGQIASLLHEKETLPLDALAARVCRQSRDDAPDEDHFSATFIAPDMQWQEDYQSLKETGKAKNSGRLMERVARRLDWEVYSEFSLRAGIGRTLENSGYAAGGVDVARFYDAMRALCQQLRAEFDAHMQGVSDEQVAHLALGVIRRQRLAGAVMHPAFDSYRLSGGKTFMMSQKENTRFYMPPFGGRSRTPAYATFGKISEFHQLIGAKSNHSWYQHWLSRTLSNGENLFISSEAQTIFSYLFARLADAGIVKKFSTGRAGRAGNDEAFALLPGALVVSREVVQLRCSCCRSVLHAPADQGWLWQRAPCLSLRCEGRYLLAGNVLPGNGLTDNALADNGLTGNALTGNGLTGNGLTGNGLTGNALASNALAGNVLASNAAANPAAPWQWQYMDVARVQGAEHTGLLSREAREATETSFHHSEKPWNINLLSATPTLEMGIDVGDLSAILLCSVPPAEANYLQRIGRAGRKDGNALNITVAEGNPHDQFFFEEPLEMMQGQIRAPGVFLNATAILERQLAAFCMDCWVKTGVPQTAICKNVKQMLDGLEATQQAARQTHAANAAPGIFPYNFLHYVQQHHAEITGQFLAIFPDLTEETRQQLAHYLAGNQQKTSSGSVRTSLEQRVHDALNLLLKERKSLSSRATTLKRTIDKLKSAPHDQNYAKDWADLHAERDALLALVRQINSKQTLNFFTDEGLLPNYAFPEAGVTLRSVLWRRKESAADENNASNNASGNNASNIQPGEENHRQYVRTTIEYERPAAAALAELAPLNNFYAGGHKVEIEQIDMETSEEENWRICPRCNYSENIDQTGDGYKCCPKCGDTQWSDSGQKMTLLKLRQVYARSAERHSRISDDSDNREPAFFQRQLLVSFEQDAVKETYSVHDSEVPFGFEFLSKVTLRDINFGRITANGHGKELPIAGEIKPCNGFKVCKCCGMVQRSTNSGQTSLNFSNNDYANNSQQHDRSCKYYHDHNKAQFIDCLYLYRQLESEALRILLPVSSYSNDQVVEASLSAAIQLGMKYYFKGNVDHLKGVVYSEPEGKGDLRRKYLVIYDSIPGGTGSLKELMRTPENLLTLLEMAYQALAECSCNQDTGKDGCYRCIYAYRDRKHMKYVSRDQARSLLAKILQARASLRRIESVNDISLDEMMGSELEKRFIFCLQKNKHLQVSRSYARQDDGWIIHVSALTDGGLASSAPENSSWHLKPQVDLGVKDNVAIPCCPDYVLYPRWQPDNAQPDNAQSDAVNSDIKRSDIKPVAIFLDGFAFHKSIVADDVQKRQAIKDSGKYWVWTISWHDLHKPGLNHVQEVMGLCHQPKMKEPQLYNQWHGTNFATLESSFKGQNSFALLLDYITHPLQKTRLWQKAAAAHAFVWLDVTKFNDLAAQQKYAYEMQENAPPYRLPDLLPDEAFVFGGLLDSCRSSQKFIELTALILANDLTKDVPVKIKRELMPHLLRLHVCFDDRHPQDNDYEKGLAGFWYCVNLLQFLPDMTFTSRHAVHQLSTGSAHARGDAPATGSTPDGTADASAAENIAAAGSAPADEWLWSEIREFGLLSEQEIALLQHFSLPAPVVGYELQNADGAIIAEADLAWIAQKQVLITDNPHHARLFAQHGWRVVQGAIDKLTLQQLTAINT